MHYFTPKFFTFLRSLKRHNDREWFADNRERYLSDVEAPMLQFIHDFGPRLRRISPAYVADPRRSGGSMFRIYRDTRFSGDKSPFKTWAAARFAHEARRGLRGGPAGQRPPEAEARRRRATRERSGALGAPRATARGGPAGQRPPDKNDKNDKNDNVPAFYLHLASKECYGGGGVYHLDMPALTRIRQRIVSAPREWAAVRKTGILIEGDTLTRPPAGFDPTHPFIEDLKRKDLYTLTEFTERDVVSADFLDRYTAACERAAPLLEFLTRALGLRW